MLQSTVRLVITAQHQPEVLRTLRVLTAHATVKAGCVSFSVVQDITDPTALTICDRWVSREDFNAYIRSEDYRLVLAVMDLSVTPPEISFDDLTHLGGLDVIQALRAPRGADSVRTN